MTESEWSEQDQAWILALAEYRAGLCPSCRRPLRECADPAADGGYKVPAPTRCHVTTALLSAQEQYKDSPQAGALLWHAERKG